MTIKTRNFVRIISFFIATIAVLGGFLEVKDTEKEQIELATVNSYERSLSQATDYLSQIDTDLEKLRYCTENEYLGELSSSISANAAAAKVLISEIPLSQKTSGSINKFLAQAGDFSTALSKQKTLSKNNIDSLENLSKYSNSIANSFSEINASSDYSDIKELDVEQIETEFDNSNKSAKDYPTLIYDGPFSDHITTAKPKLLENAPDFSKMEATKKAEDLIGFGAKYISDENSSCPSYLFSNDNKTVAITKKGGYLLYMQKSATVRAENKSISYAINTALGTLRDIYELEFCERYYMINEGIVTINFAYCFDGIICYPDLIKVSVSLDNATILGIDARNFIMAHFERKKQKAKIDIEKAQKKVSTDLSVLSAKKCIIADDALNEFFCYEFYCKAENDEKFLVYINAQNGAEEQILLLEDAPNGTLTR